MQKSELAACIFDLSEVSRNICWHQRLAVNRGKPQGSESRYAEDRDGRFPFLSKLDVQKERPTSLVALENGRTGGNR